MIDLTPYQKNTRDEIINTLTMVVTGTTNLSRMFRQNVYKG